MIFFYYLTLATGLSILYGVTQDSKESASVHVTGIIMGGACLVVAVNKIFLGG